MGRGRAKAKQTKVARQLKYNAPQTDLCAARESGASGETQHVVEKEVADDQRRSATILRSPRDVRMTTNR
jgi:hypothetical protein